MQSPELKRGLFGYSRRSVRLVLADRDGAFIRAAERARETEGRVAELESEVRALLDDLARQAAHAREAEERYWRYEGLLDLLRRELGSARRDLLRQFERARNAEATVERLDAELRSAREELGSARRSPTLPEPSQPVVVLPDLDGHVANGTRREPEEALRPE